MQSTVDSEEAEHHGQCSVAVQLVGTLSPAAALETMFNSAAGRPLVSVTGGHLWAMVGWALPSGLVGLVGWWGW